jgi:hypothetical protein
MRVTAPGRIMLDLIPRSARSIATEYEWVCLGKNEVQIPFTNDAVRLDSVRDKPDLGHPRAGKLLWERHGEKHGV